MSKSKPDQETAGLAKQAVQVSKETTSILQQTLAQTEGTKVIGIATVEELKRQDELLDKNLDKAQEIHDTVYSAKTIARYMNQCFCCFICCDPPEKRAARQARAANARKEAKGPPLSTDDPRQQLLGEQKPEKYQPSAAPKYADTLGEHGMGAEGTTLDKEHDKQERIVGQICDNLDELHDIAKAQGELIAGQTGKISNLQGAVEAGRHATDALNADIKQLRRK